MGMILGADGFNKFKVGYPTVSDKYDVQGGVFTGATPVAFGDFVASTSDGNYTNVTTTNTATQIAGIVLATNVKLASEPEHIVETSAGDACNLLLDGYVAVELDSGAVAADILPGTACNIKLSTAKLTTVAVATGIINLPGYYFTGEYEMHGTAIVAEVKVIFHA